MTEMFSLAEAAAISEVSPERIRTALEKNAIPLSRKRKTGRVVRHQFSFHDVFLLALLDEFPFPLSRKDKVALQTLVMGKAKKCGSWRIKGADFVFRSGAIIIVAECKQVKNRLSENLSTFQRGKGRIVMSRAIMNGTPVFRGTRISLEHIAELLRKGVSEHEIAEDYPRLKPLDLAYARLYSRVGPRPGRPKKPLQIRRKQKAA